MQDEFYAKIYKELGHPVRLAIIKDLVCFASSGLSVGALQDALKARGQRVPPSTLTHHLKALKAAGLISQKKEGKSVLSFANIELLGKSASYILQNCCQGKGC